MLAGNKADVEWNPDAALKMQELFSQHGFKDVVFVADCTLISTGGLRRLAEKRFQFISRLPETFNLAEELKNTAWEQDTWEDIGQLANAKTKQAATYKTFSVRRELDGRKYDFLVVQSSMLEVRKEKTVTETG